MSMGAVGSRRRRPDPPIAVVLGDVIALLQAYVELHHLVYETQARQADLAVRFPVEKSDASGCRCRYAGSV